MKKILLAFVLCIMSYAAFAAASSPVNMLQQTSNQMISALKASPNRTTNTLYSIIQRILLPKVDLAVMSQQVVGSSYWQGATDAERREFQKQFTKFVTRTYSSALSSYKDERIHFFPVRDGAIGKTCAQANSEFIGKTCEQVNSEIDQKNGQAIPVSYKLILNAGQWKVYDFSVYGISMVENYRAQFADVLRQQGFSGLLQRLQAHNAG